MHLDYRCYVKFRDSSLWQKALTSLAMEAGDGNEYSFLEIGEVFRNMIKLFEMMDEPITNIFDTVTMFEEEAFYFIHDHKKSFSFFEGLTNYIFETIANKVGENFVLIADVTNYDDDSMGNHIYYYLGEKKSVLHKFVVEGPEGLEHHENNIADIDTMLVDAPITAEQKDTMNAIVGSVHPVDLMNNLQYQIMPEGFDFDEDEELDADE